MSYKTTDLLNERENKLLTILNKNVKEKYAVLVKIRLSEFLYSTQTEGSDAFYDEFQAVNLVTIPFAIFDMAENKLAAIVYFSDNDFEAKSLLEMHNVPCIEISAFRDVLVSESLARYME